MQMMLEDYRYMYIKQARAGQKTNFCIDSIKDNKHVNKLIWHDVVFTRDQRAFFKQQVSIAMM